MKLIPDSFLMIEVETSEEREVGRCVMKTGINAWDISYVRDEQEETFIFLRSGGCLISEESYNKVMAKLGMREEEPAVGKLTARPVGSFQECDKCGHRTYNMAEFDGNCSGVLHCSGTYRSVDKW